MRLLITGDRHWRDYEIILRALMDLAPDIICHGKAKGADSFAGHAAVRLGIAVIEYPAQWHIYGKAAGPIRNQQMLTEFKPTSIAAFHNELRLSKGTLDMVCRSLRGDIPVRLFTYDC